MLRITSQRARQRDPALNPEDIARATELARKDKATPPLGGKGNESPLGRVYHKNKQRRYHPPQPPPAHPAPDDVNVGLAKKKKPALRITSQNYRRQRKKYKKPAPTPIPGSKYFRAFCAGCGEAIRVSDSRIPYCSDCDPKFGGRAGKSRSHYNPDIEWGGYVDTPINE